MKHLYLVLSLFILATIQGQTVQDTLYVWKAGNLVIKQSIKSTDMDSITFKRPIKIIPSLPSITIGTQTWQAKNLDVTTYRNGDVIPEVQDATAWANLTTGAWCHYDNNPANDAIYGKLYNWHAVNDPRGLAPAGFHVPTDAEWTTLTTYLGGESIAGGKMKEAGTTHWFSPNEDATNSSGFTGLPGGYRNSDGSVDGIGYGGFWWSSSENDTTDAWYRDLYYDNGYAGRYGASKKSGFSVRCLVGEPAVVVAPTITTTAVSSIGTTTASSGGAITADGGASVTQRGLVWSTSTNPTIALSTKTEDGTGTGTYTSALSGLIAGTTYYVRAYATNSGGTGYGAEVSFATLPAVAPTITTTAVNSIGSTTASSGGAITADGGASVTQRGLVWSTSTNPTIALSTKTEDGTGTGTYTSALSGLIAATTYYVRAYATNSAGTGYGAEVSFATLPPPTEVVIGTQTWKIKNLDVATYRNGDVIPEVQDATAWASLTTGAWCHYNNNPANDAIYGKLYNWYAVNDSRGLAPSGFHVPTDTELTALTDMKNPAGFAGLPGGTRASTGTFANVGTNGAWWSSSKYATTYAWLRYLDYTFGIASRYYYYKESGFSVRCLRD